MFLKESLFNIVEIVEIQNIMDERGSYRSKYSFIFDLLCLLLQMVLLHKLLQRLKEGGHRVLIFSQVATNVHKSRSICCGLIFR